VCVDDAVQVNVELPQSNFASKPKGHPYRRTQIAMNQVGSQVGSRTSDRSCRAVDCFGIQSWQRAIANCIEWGGARMGPWSLPLRRAQYEREVRHGESLPWIKMV